MPGPEFFQTGYGRRFFDAQLPQLIRALNHVGDTVLLASLAKPDDDLIAALVDAEDFISESIEWWDMAGIEERAQHAERVIAPLRAQITKLAPDRTKEAIAVLEDGELPPTERLTKALAILKGVG